MVEGRQACEGGQALWVGVAELGHESEQDLGGDRSDTWCSGQQTGLLAQAVVALDVALDLRLEAGDGFAEAGDHLLQVFSHKGVCSLCDAVLFHDPHGHELVASGGEGGQTGTMRAWHRVGLWAQAFTEVGEHGGVQGVGLGLAAAGLGVAAHQGGVEPCIGHAGLVQGRAQGVVIGAGGLEDQEASRGGKLGREAGGGLGAIGDAPQSALGGIEKVQPMLGHVASDVAVR